MNTFEHQFPTRLRIMQIISAALMMGVLSFMGVSVIIVQGGNVVPPAVPIQCMLAGGMLAINLVVAFVLPGAIARGGVRNLAQRPGPSEEGADRLDLLPLRQTTLIITLALFEGAAFFGLVGYIAEANPLGLGVALAGLVLQLTQFPTEGRVRAWLDTHAQLLNELRRERGERA